MYEDRKKQWEDKIIKAIKDRIYRDIRNLFEQGEEDYYMPVRAGNSYSNNYIEYKSIGDRNKPLSIKEYLDEIESYLKGILNNLKNMMLGNSINNSS